MTEGELRLLMRDKIPEAIRLVHARAATGSLTEKILQGWFGEASKYALYARKAHELARAANGY